MTEITRGEIVLEVELQKFKAQLKTAEQEFKKSMGRMSQGGGATIGAGGGAAIRGGNASAVGLAAAVAGGSLVGSIAGRGGGGGGVAALGGFGGNNRRAGIQLALADQRSGKGRAVQDELGRATAKNAQAINENTNAVRRHTSKLRSASSSLSRGVAGAAGSAGRVAGGIGRGVGVLGAGVFASINAFDQGTLAQLNTEQQFLLGKITRDEQQLAQGTSGGPIMSFINRNRNKSRQSRITTRNLALQSAGISEQIGLGAAASGTIIRQSGLIRQQADASAIPSREFGRSVADLNVARTGAIGDVNDQIEVLGVRKRRLEATLNLSNGLSGAGRASLKAGINALGSQIEGLQARGGALGASFNARRAEIFEQRNFTANDLLLGVRSETAGLLATNFLGDPVQARQIAIKESFRGRIQQARDLGATDLTGALTKLRDLQVRNAEFNQRPAQGFDFFNRFTGVPGGEAGQAARADVQKEIRNLLKSIDKNTAKDDGVPRAG